MIKMLMKNFMKLLFGEECICQDFNRYLLFLKLSTTFSKRTSALGST